MPGILCRHGHVVTGPELRRLFGWDAVVSRVVHRPDVVRIRKAVYACAHLSEAEFTALRCGGRLDCASVLVHYGISFPGAQADEVHVRVRSRQGHTAERVAELGAVRLHWTARPRPQVFPYWSDKLRVTLPEALLQAARCLERDAFAAAFSAAGSGALSQTELSAVIEGLPRRVHAGLRRNGLL